MTPLLLLLSAFAHAANVDNLEIGGLWGSPGATDATALWWNPAGLAADTGTRVHLEGAPTLAGIKYDRDDPLYGHGGEARFSRFGVVPAAFVASDLGVKGLGVGLGLAAPTLRGAKESGTLGTSPARYALQDANVQSAHAMLGLAYAPVPTFSLGATVQLVADSWKAQMDTETLTALRDSLEEQHRDTSQYSDAMLEDPDYSARVYLGGQDGGSLSGTGVTFSGGARLQANEKVAISLAYIHGHRVATSGDAHMSFQCPPQSDTWGRLGSELAGLCYAELDADASVSYTLPARVHLGVVIEPKDGLQVELMGAWIGWHVFTDYTIDVSNVAARNPDLGNPDYTASKVEQHRQQARSGRDSFWAGVNVRAKVGEDWTFGGRALFDRSAIPSAAMSANNYDADDLVLSAMAARKAGPVELGLSASGHLLMKRTITDNAFALSLASPVEDRYFYPQNNGTYTGYYGRLDLVTRLHFGGSGWRSPGPQFSE